MTPSMTDTDRATDTSRSTLHTTVQNVATYPVPILAALRGRAVRLIAIGDMPGHSPVLQCIDDTGKVAWHDQAEFIVVDTAFLPPTPAALQAINQALAGTSATR